MQYLTFELPQIFHEKIGFSLSKLIYYLQGAEFFWNPKSWVCGNLMVEKKLSARISE